MKNLFTLCLFVFSLNAFAGADLDLVASCVRADSGNSPEVKVFASSDKSVGLIMLNTGAVETFEESEFFFENTPIQQKDAYDSYNGVDVSITIPTQLETETEKFYTELTVHGETSNIAPWLKANTNIQDDKLGFADVTIDLVCDQVN